MKGFQPWPKPLIGAFINEAKTSTGVKVVFSQDKKNTIQAFSRMLVSNFKLNVRTQLQTIFQ